MASIDLRTLENLFQVLINGMLLTVINIRDRTSPTGTGRSSGPTIPVSFFPSRIGFHTQGVQQIQRKTSLTPFLHIGRTTGLQLQQ